MYLILDINKYDHGWIHSQQGLPQINSWFNETFYVYWLHTSFCKRLLHNILLSYYKNL